MKLFLPFIISFLIGSVLFGAIYKKEAWKDPLAILVSFWLGLATSSFVAFYSILILGRFDPLNVIITTLIVLIGACLACYYRQAKPFLCFQGIAGGYWLKFLLVVTIAWIFMMGLAYHNFYGDWDAWSFWNYRARYLISSGVNWRDIFAWNTHHQPWCLSYWIVFGWTWIGAQSYDFTLFSAQIFGLIVLATVFFSILNLTKNEDASLLGSMWLASMPYFLKHSISQYADVMTASQIVLTMMLFFRLNQTKARGDAFTIGVMLSIMAFSKDEGITSAVLVLLILAVGLRKNLNLFPPLCLGICLTLIPTILVKIWMVPAPSGVNTLYLPYIVDWHRWVYVFLYLFSILSKPYFGGALVLPFALLVSRLLRITDTQDRIMISFLTMFMGLFYFLYILVGGNLTWRLLATAERLVYLILPLAIVFLFYRLFKSTSR